MTLALDYASILNHHENANVQAGRFPEKLHDLQFRVRMGFVCGDRSVLKMQYACMQAHTQDTRARKHFQGHKRYASWTGSFCPVWRCTVV